MAYKINKEYLNRWFDNGARSIPMTEKTSSEDLEYIFTNQKQEYVSKVEEVKTTKKNK
jgi:hypothetical protein